MAYFRYVGNVGGSGGIVGPGSSTDKAIVRWNGTDGTTIQNSALTIDDSGIQTFVDGAAATPYFRSTSSNSGLFYVNASFPLGISIAGGQLVRMSINSFEMSTSTASAAALLSTTNSDNTSGTSQALVSATVGGNSGGDPYFSAGISGASNVWVWGLDNSASDAFTLGYSTALLGNGTLMTISTAGAYTLDATSSTNGHTWNGRTLDFLVTGTSPVPRLQISNATTGDGAAHARLVATVADGTAGDPSMTLTITGVTAWHVGADNSDSDCLSMGTSGTVGTNQRFKLTTAGDAFFSTGDVSISTAGKGLLIKEGTNAKMGRATLVGGTVVVSTTAVTANSEIFLTTQTPGGTLGAVYVSARTAATSFTITSISAIDTSIVAWMIVEPAA